MARLVNLNIDQGSTFSTKLLAYETNPYSLDNGQITENTDFLPIDLGTITGYVESISITSGGNGYTSIPSVTISGGGGSAATAGAEISGGAVTKIYIVNKGDGYTSNPTVTISAPTSGSTATATSRIQKEAGINGALINLVGATVRGQLRYSPSSSSAVTFTVSTNTTTSEVTLSLTATQTAALKPGRYVYDVEATLADTTVKRLFEGEIRVNSEVTKI